jgi:hypothetical protein
MAVLATLWTAAPAAQAFDETKYPDLSGQWTDLDVRRWDPSRPRNLGQKAPLTPEYQAKLEAAMADRANGGRGNTPTISCGHTGMPRSMLLYEAMEFSVHPNITYLMFDFVEAQFLQDPNRRWRWLAHAAIIAKHGLNDNTLALKYADELARLAGRRNARLQGSAHSRRRGIPLHADNQTVVMSALLPMRKCRRAAQRDIDR